MYERGCNPHKNLHTRNVLVNDVSFAFESEVRVRQATLFGKPASGKGY